MAQIIFDYYLLVGNICTVALPSCVCLRYIFYKSYGCIAHELKAASLLAAVKAGTENGYNHWQLANQR
jgi:hypothetical protein